MAHQHQDEHTRLLRDGKPNDSIGGQNGDSESGSSSGHNNDGTETVDFADNDKGNPRDWPLRFKYLQVLLVSMIALVCPMASSISAPGTDNIAHTFHTSTQNIIGSQAGFVCMLGIGPLFFAPMSETFGRRTIFLVNLTIFTILQIPTALATSVEWFVVLRTLGGLFGSVGVANGGGSISDLFETKERATVLGFYLLGPLLG